MTIYESLKSDHDKVEKLLQKLKKRKVPKPTSALSRP
jgi:hypothetical protein